MKKILCPTDFSESAHTAIAYAAKLAQAINAQLTLLNVQYLYDYTPVELIRGKEMSIVAAAEQLEAQSREVSKVFTISCYAEVEPTFRGLSSIIAQKGKQYDLIVMGTDGPDNLYQFFRGSNTYKAMVKSETPILLVPSGYLYNEIEQVVFAFDYLHEKTIPLTRLIPFIKALNARLTVLQILENKYSEQEQAHVLEQQSAIKNFYSEMDIRFETVHSSELPQTINSYIMRSEPDLLILCSIHHKLLERLFHKSVIKDLTAYSNYPILVFHL